MKILAPAGNFECLKVAVYNGATEVYLGINEFNARNNTDGFTLDNLEKAVDFAHLFGVKVNLAINILFNDSELLSALNTAVKAYNLGVDSFIVQDLGLIKLLATYYPQLELHASTQMGIHNLEGVNALEKYNIKRVVLARETPLAEIKRIRQNSNVELEYFCQGALCVSFSGNCYLSSYLFDKSGNRGRCKQLCRLPFTLEKDGKKIKRGYLLSAKDFNMSSRIGELKDAGIDVIKIEGRARRPFYVATATREYYNAVHGKNANQDMLKLAFNRTYTAGYFDGNGNIISNIQNHVGIKIGKVEKVNYGKNFNQVYFSSNRELSPKSAIKFIGESETTISAYDLKPHGVGKYMLTTTQRVKVSDIAYLIVDDKLEKEALFVSKKKCVDISVYAGADKEIIARVNIDGDMVEISGAVCLPARSQPLTQANILQNFSKSELFCAKVNASVNDAFLTKKELNEFRRKVFDAIYKHITQKYKRSLDTLTKLPDNKILSFNDYIFVDSPEFSAKEKNIIYSPEIYSLDGVEKFIANCKKKEKTPYLDTPNFALDKDVEMIREIISKTKIAIVANNYYALNFKTKIVIGGGLNVYNALSASELNAPVITAESDIASKSNFAYMTLRHCPMKAHLSATCDKCAYKNGYIYKMDSGKVLRLKRKKLSTCTFYLTD